MNFIERNAENLRKGNLTLTFIILCAILGMSGWMYVDFTQNEKVTGNPSVVSQVVLPSTTTGYESDAYKAVASLMSVIVITAVTVGILISKINNEYFKSDSAEVVFLFILLLVAVTLVTLDLIPDEDVENGSDETDIRETSFAVSSIIMIAIALGMVTNISGIAKMYNVFGTGVGLTLMVIVLGLISYLYTLLGEERDVPKGNIGRVLTNGERNVLITTLSLVAVVVVLAFFHIMLEYKAVRRMLGMKSPKRSESPKRVSPKRKTSPRRKVGSLKP